ncbi:MAG: glycoside hydrolase family 13 protein [Culicoidibacterales bacterium]
MDKAALYHRSLSTYAYAYNNQTIHLKIRTKRNDIIEATILFGDPYDHNFGGGGNLAVKETTWNHENLPMRKIASTEHHDFWFIEVKPSHKRLQYGFILTDTHGEQFFFAEKGIFDYDNLSARKNIGNYFKFPFLHGNDAFQAPSWVKDTTWYQIFPERFANGNPEISPKHVIPWGSKDPAGDDFFGGDLKGIIQNLDYLVDLGITGIYLTPVFESPSNHKYDTTDYFKIDPHFGTAEDFKRLVELSHQRGLKVMIDAVFNHLGNESPYWKDVVKNGADSQYADWFHVYSFPVSEGMNGNYEGSKALSFDTFAFTPKMPKLNTQNPTVKQYLLDIATYWIREFNIDGWRLDVANEIDHAFWKDFRRAVHEVKPDVFILGEIWHDSYAWLAGDEFDSVMNYPFTDAILQYFADHEITSTQFMYRINQQLMSYTQNINEVMFNLLDSHDTARLLTRTHGNTALAESALAFMFAQTGSPCIYYGTEIGLDGGADPLCRKCMVWDPNQQDQNLFAFTKKLIAIRKNYQTIFTYGELNWLDVRDDQTYIIFERKLAFESMLYIFNNTAHDQSIQLPLDYVDRLALNLFTDTEFCLTESINVPAHGFVALKLH